MISPLLNVTERMKMARNAIDMVHSNFKGKIDELETYRSVIPLLIDYINILETSYMYIADPKYNKNKRWSKEEDEYLIESVCEDDAVPLPVLASGLGRTAQSIKQRISYLVGVKRLSQQIAGKFIGTVNGEESEVQLEGTLYKE